MNDELLYALRREPRPEFADRLRARLAHQSQATPAIAATWPVRRIVTTAAAAGVAALLFAFPAVRASAQAFLNLFRVVNFVAVPMDADRLRLLGSPEVGLDRLLGDHVEVLVPPGPPQPFLTPDLAGAAAGLQVRVPGTIPSNLVMTGVRMLPEQTIRVTADTERLRRVLESLAIRDLTIPDTLDGQTATITVPPIVEMKYESANRMAILVQARSPNITVPAGLDLPLFGEIGLRILGLGRAEARRFAHAIDWHTTLLVPVPANATSFRQVDVAGRRGLVIETAASPASQQRRQRFTIVLWSDGGQMFAMRGTLNPRDMLEMASSVP